MLANLAPYGTGLNGPASATRAHKPAVGSPVLAIVPIDQCPLLDQAYKERASALCDIGAVQLNGSDALIGAVKFSEPTYEVSELGVTATVKVSRVNGDQGEIGVQFYDSEQGTAARNSDYKGIDARYIQWADGDSSDELIEVTIYNDNLEEGTETIEFSLAGASGGAAIGGISDTAILSIIDDETSQSVFTFETPVANVAEDGQAIALNVVRGADNGNVASVSVSTADGSAIAGADYTSVSRTLTFAAGESSQVLEIPIVDDSEMENDETFTVVLTNPSTTATVGLPAQIEITIKGNDNDVPGETTGSGGATTADSSGDTAGDSTADTSGNTSEGTAAATGGTSGSTTTGTTTGESTGSTTGNVPVGAPNTSNTDPQQDPSGQVEPEQTGPIDVGDARGSGGSVGAIFAFILFLSLGLRRKLGAVL